MGTSVATREVQPKAKSPRKISIDTFLRKYRKGGPGVKYEYNKGVIEKTEAMKYNERYIIQNLRKVFTELPAYKNGGSLECETEIWTSEDQWRKPDISYSSLEQTRAATEGYNPIPEFIIEVISPNDKINQVRNEVYEYFEAGVKIVWHIFPELKAVDIYRSPEDIETCSGKKTCSAEPVVKGFKIKAEDIFKEV